MLAGLTAYGALPRGSTHDQCSDTSTPYRGLWLCFNHVHYAAEAGHMHRMSIRHRWTTVRLGSHTGTCACAFQRSPATDTCGRVLTHPQTHQARKARAGVTSDSHTCARLREMSTDRARVPVRSVLLALTYGEVLELKALGAHRRTTTHQQDTQRVSSSPCAHALSILCYLTHN